MPTDITIITTLLALVALIVWTILNLLLEYERGGLPAAAEPPGMAAMR